MNSRGFTMIELLIAAAIFSLILTSLTIAFIQQQRQSNLTQEDIDLEQTARASLNYIASEIRNATSREGKTFSLGFVNGGNSDCINNKPNPANTSNPGTVNSPPDCLTVYTWDIARGEDTTQPANPLAPRFPSIPGVVSVVSEGPPLVLQLPDDWFPTGGTQLVQNGDLLGFRSRINLCSPNASVSCGTNPASCTECAAILKVNTIDSATKQATIADDVSSIIQQNFQTNNFSTMSSFINTFFIPIIAQLTNEMTIVRSRTFTVDTTSKQLEMQQNGGGSFQAIAGGSDAPGIVDLQFVFNLQDADGGITKVGICSSGGNCKDTTKRMFSDFVADPSLLGRQKDIRSVEIYLLVRSRVKTPLIQGSRIPVQTIPAIGDVPQRNTSDPSFGATSGGVGYMYRFFSTTIYIRNMAREDFG
jgi:prepilin-type N-terminal cleavage/methylation domain-containing protein